MKRIGQIQNAAADEKKKQKIVKDRRFDPEKVFKALDETDYSVKENKISLKGDADMNDVFVPQKCEQEEIDTVLFI